MNQQKIGEFLKHLRKEKNLTQEQLAEHFNISSRTVSRWETGRNMPDLEILIELSDFYDADIREIIDGERKSGNDDIEQKESFTKMADYSRYREKIMLKKLAVIITVGIFAWGASLSFALYFMNSARGGGFILMGETISLLLYVSGMLCVKTNRSADGFLNIVIGAVTAIVISNLALLVIFFGSGNYHNYGLVGVFYFLLTLFVVFMITGIIASCIGKKEKSEL